MNYGAFFRPATKTSSKPGGRQPHPYQHTFAVASELPELLNIPTGAGKTATVILGWCYRRRQRPKSTLRQPVYCLPMPTVVETVALSVRLIFEGSDA